MHRALLWGEAAGMASLTTVLLVVPLVLALSGCLRDPVDVLQTEGGVVLVGLVATETDTASVVLSRVAVQEDPERGATLRLGTPHGSVALSEAPLEACGLTSGWACYRGAYEALPRPGEVYHLEGTLAGGAPLFGTTTVPDPPALVYSRGPGAGSPVADTLRASGLRTPLIELESPDEGTWVSILGGEIPADVWAGGGLERCTATVFERSFNLRFASFPISVTEPTCKDDFVVWDSMSVELRVGAFDPSFSSYWEKTQGTTQSLFPDQAAWGIDGVLGVFGSSASRRLVLIVSNPTRD